MKKILHILMAFPSYHKFFMSEGLDFVRMKGIISRRDAFYAPFAYLKFMRYSFFDVVMRARFIK